MATPKSKANIGMTLVILFAITLVTGIILHLKKHGIIIEPRSVIKIVHWIAGLLMVGLALVHGLQFKKMLSAMKAKFLWFWGDTLVVIVFICLTIITGAVKFVKEESSVTLAASPTQWVSGKAVAESLTTQPSRSMAARLEELL